MLLRKNRFFSYAHHYNTYLPMDTTQKIALIEVGVKRALLTLVWIFTGIVVCSAQSTFYFPQIADGIQGGGITWKTTLLIANSAPSGTAATGVTIEFTTSGGAPFNIAFDGTGFTSNGNTVTMTISGGQTRRLVSSGAGALTVGWARVTTSSNVSGTALFSEFGPAGLITEAGVPSSNAVNKQAIFVDQTSGFNTGVAYANPNSSAATIGFQLIDADGVGILSSTRTLAGSQHTATLVSQLFPAAPAMTGLLRMDSSVPLAVIALRLAPAGQLTTLPPVTLASLFNWPAAFFYQTVDPVRSTVRAGATWDGANTRTYDADLVRAKDGKETSYGDPVFSRLSNGRWAMTAWTAPNDPRGSGLMYYEGVCPAVDASAVKVFSASTASGCEARNPAMAKTSQVFDAGGSNFVMTMSNGEVYLTRLSDATRSTTSLTSICLKQSAVTSVQDLRAGESSRVLSKTTAGDLLLSDTAIARRIDGTWVLFVKAIPGSVNSACRPGSICELCGRGIYRTVSSDLLHWSALEKVVSQASVPEATRYPDGTVWLYFQNFSRVCTANDLNLAERAPITGVYELEGGNTSSGFDVKFWNEAFESDTSLHYPTNGNPIFLPNAEAYEALNACIGRTPR